MFYFFLSVGKSLNHWCGGRKKKQIAYNGLWYEKLEIKIPKHEYSEDMTEGFEIIVSEIPEGVHKIRFVNSW